MSLSPIFDHFRCSMKLTIMLSFNLLQLLISYIYLFCIVTWSPKKWTSTLTKMLFNRFFIFCFRTNSFSTITICMGQFKKYVTPKIAIFRPPPPCHTLSYFASTPSPHVTHQKGGPFISDYFHNGWRKFRIIDGLKSPIMKLLFIDYFHHDWTKS